ncbi:polyadenylate-binding protein 7 [Nematostella vectensis]|uniref:polyadenylate-binding protein 7 n=1 Tax=Nematostella vectensis TaxID=45351 RepID=UPI001390548A|nr:polyadenylate-binding protein 7 [Nematostella vectensis]
MFFSLSRLKLPYPAFSRILRTVSEQKFGCVFFEKPAWPPTRGMCAIGKLAEIQHSIQELLSHKEEHDQRTIYIRDFRPDIRKSSLESVFGPYGAIEDLSIIRTQTGKSKGFGYVTYENAESAQRALAGTHIIDGKWVIAEPKMPTRNLAGRSKKIRVLNVPQDLTRNELESYFSRFGNVKGIDFVVVDPITKERKDYCFVEFECESGALKAVETQSHIINKCNVQVQFSTSKFGYLPHTKEVIVRALGNDVTVDALQKYFSGYGDLVRVDLVCNRHQHSSNTYAFVKFENPETANLVSKLDSHIIDGQEVVVKKTALKYPMRNRHLKVFVEGLPEQTDPKELVNYLSKFGEVTALKGKQFQRQGCGVVMFRSQSSIQALISHTKHRFNGKPFSVRQLCWTKGQSLFDLAFSRHFRDKRRK